MLLILAKWYTCTDKCGRFCSSTDRINTVFHTPLSIQAWQVHNQEQIKLNTLKLTVHQHNISKQHQKVQKKQSHENPNRSIAHFFPSYYCVVPLGFLQWEIRATFLGESQLRHGRATRPTVHAGCFSVSIIHWTPTWTAGSLTCTQVLMYAIADGGVQTP